MLLAEAQDSGYPHTHLASIAIQQHKVQNGLHEAMTKFGGGKAYEKVKPLMIGLIMGELMAAAFFIVLAMLMYLLDDGRIIERMGILPY